MENESLESIIKDFTRNLSSLRDFVDLFDTFLGDKKEDFLESRANDLIPLALAMDKLEENNEKKLEEDKINKMRKTFDGEIEIEIQDDHENGKKLGTFSIEGEGQKRFNSAMDELSKSNRNTRLLYYSALMNLTSIVEWYFSQLLHFYFDKFPNAGGLKEKVFSYEDLKGFESIDDAKQHFKESKVENILRDSFKEWINYFKTGDLNLNMGYLKNQKTTLYETFLRRNLVVHNAGKVNKTYLTKASNKFTQSVEVDETLSVSRNYLDERIDLFESNCLLIAFEMWKNIDLKDCDRGDLLHDLCYYYVTEDRFQVSESLSYFLMKDKNMNETDILVGRLNYWLSKKRKGEWDEIKDEVLEVDFSAKELQFQIGYHALCENKETFFELFPKGLAGDLTVEVAYELPIYEEMRDEPEFDEITNRHKESSEKDYSN